MLAWLKFVLLIKEATTGVSGPSAFVDIKTDTIIIINTDPSSTLKVYQSHSYNMETTSHNALNPDSNPITLGILGHKKGQHWK